MSIILELNAPFSPNGATRWLPPEELTVSAHADKFRVLSPKESSEHGPWRTGRTEYLRVPMDLCGRAGVEVVVVIAPSQVGKSEGWRNGLFSWARNDPGPCMIVFPDEESCKGAIDEHVIPMVETSLRDVTSEKARDVALIKIRLTSMDIFAAWASSPARLASRPCRYVIFDEVNKYKEWTGKDANPIALGKARVRTFQHRARIIITSTPTTRDGMVTRAFADCEVQSSAEIPCPHCGAYFAPSFYGHVRWPKEIDSRDPASIARIEREGLAWLECPHCHEAISELERLGVLRHVRYPGTEAKAASIGVRFSVLVTPWTSLHKVAAKFLRVKGVPQDLMEFLNQELGEEFEDAVATLKADVLDAKAVAAVSLPRLVVPAWAGALIAGVDSQRDGHPWIVRAFGRNYRSRLMDHGHARTLEELRLAVLGMHLAIEDSPESSMAVRLLCIDARGGTSAAQRDGSMTDAVYRFSQTDDRIRAVVGYGGEGIPTELIVTKRTSYTPPGKAGRGSYEVTRSTLDTEGFKDILFAAINNEESAHWELCPGVSDDYLRQMRSEHKIQVRRGQSMRLHWRKKSDGAANHLWDAENYALAGAHMMKAELFPDEPSLRAQRVAAAKLRQDRAEGRGQPRGITSPDGRPFLTSQR